MQLKWKCFHYAVVVTDLPLLKWMHKYFCSWSFLNIVNLTFIKITI